MKYRKKPVVIDAIQFFPKDAYTYNCVDYDGKNWIIKTLEGNMIVRAGDWIITGVKGEKYPCKPDIFKETYEKAEEKEKV